jgi:RimJ/RimL family protein N-acetyltransferase
VRVVYASQNELSWIVERTSCSLGPGARGICVKDQKGVIHGMVAYDNWTENAVQAHMAVDDPTAWRSLVGPAFQYPFQEAGRGLIIGIIPSHNTRSVRLVKRFGFRETHRFKDGWAPRDDLLVFELRREECRFLGGKYGKVRTAA